MEFSTQVTVTNYKINGTKFRLMIVVVMAMVMMNMNMVSVMDILLLQAVLKLVSGIGTLASACWRNGEITCCRGDQQVELFQFLG